MKQSLHPDFQTAPEGTQYFFLGTGKIQVAIQWSWNRDLTPLGLLVSDPEHFARKWSTHLFHPEYGLGKTALGVRIDGFTFKPEHSTLAVDWSEVDGYPAVRAIWKAGRAMVEELFWCPSSGGTLHRRIRVEGLPQAHISIEAWLYGSNALFDRFGQQDRGLYATGYGYVSLVSESTATASERTLTIEGREATLRYSISKEPTTAGRPSKRSSLRTDDSAEAITRALVELYTKAATGLSAAIAESGRFDASIWQYGFEWSGDASHVAEALVYSGQFEVARTVLVNLLTRLSNDEGMVAESSRFRGGMDSELNSNGAVLHACHTYLDWTGDVTLIRDHASRIERIADYLLRPEFLDAETHMLRSERDIWERSAALGVRPGYDLSHQVYGVIGLDAAAKLGHALEQDWSRFARASEAMRRSVLSHPTHSLIENGRFIKRRESTGAHQSTVHVIETETNREFLAMFRPKGTPMELASEAPWEPDACEVFPICYRLVRRESEVARHTLSEMEILWSQAWPGGGYGRYHVAAEPDSPGAWPFATAFIAAAQLEVGEIELAKRSIDWLIQKAGAAGSWFEFYGDRPTPPLPPTGIIVWGWAQFITLVVKHVLAVDVINGRLHAAPRLHGISASLRFREGVEEVGE